MSFTNHADNNGNTHLIHALFKHDIETAKLLLGKSDINIQNNKGKTALTIATENKLWDFAKEIIDKCDVDYSKHHDIAKILVKNEKYDLIYRTIDKSNDPTYIDSIIFNTLNYDEKVCSNILNAFTAKVELTKTNTLIASLKKNDPDLSYKILKFYKKISSGEVFYSALIHRDENLAFEIAKKSPNALDDENHTPLMIALLNKKTELAQKIFDTLDTNVNQTDKLGYSTFELALMAKSDLAYKIYQKCPTIKDQKNRTPLMIAINKYNKDVALKIIQDTNNNNIMAKDADGKTALMYAIENKEKDLIPLIIEKMEQRPTKLNLFQKFLGKLCPRENS